MRNRSLLVSPGTEIDGRYRVETLLAMGAHSQVFKARQRDGDRTVVLKLADIDTGSTEAAAQSSRFLWEAEVASELEAPCFVDVYDVGMLSSGGLYMVLEYLQGLTLRDHLAKLGVLSVQRASRLMLHLLRGLDVAHGARLVSRQLTPDNLFVCDAASVGERLCVVDFAMARRLDDSGPDPGRAELVLGDARYMAPEFVRDLLMSPAMDVYQLALVFVEMMSGRPAVGERRAERCQRLHENGELDLPDGLLTTPLGPVLVRALEPEHEERYQRASDFADALERALSELPARESWVGAEGLTRADESGTYGLPVTDDQPVVRRHPIAEIRRRAEVLRRSAESGELEKAQAQHGPHSGYWRVEVNVPSEEMPALDLDAPVDLPELLDARSDLATIDLSGEELELEDLEFET